MLTITDPKTKQRLQLSDAHATAVLAPVMRLLGNSTFAATLADPLLGNSAVVSVSVGLLREIRDALAQCPETTMPLRQATGPDASIHAEHSLRDVVALGMLNDEGAQHGQPPLASVDDSIAPEHWRRHADAALVALATAEPTDSMLRAGSRAADGRGTGLALAVWRAMTQEAPRGE